MIQLIMVITTMSKNKADKALPDLVYDANEEQWANYIKIYPTFNINPQKLYLDTSKTRLVGRFKYSAGNITDTISITHINENESQDMTIVLSGDCFFNFSKEKIDYFKINIKSMKEETSKRLDSVTGAMNNVKGKAYFLKDGTLAISGNGRRPFNAYDRPDTLIYMLDQFYSKKEEKLSLYDAGLFFSSSIFRDSLNGMNFSEYYNFMNSFNSADDFCRVLFKIDSDFTKRMIDSGKKPIKSEEDLLNYLNLAQDYWKIRKQQAMKLRLPTSWHPI